MSENLLHAELREETGKEFSKKIRREGKVPGVFYSHNEKTLAITLDERELMKVLVAEGGLLDIQIDKKKKRKAIIKEVQTDPVKQTLVHVDVMGVKMKEKVTLSVPFNFVGEAIGVKDQGGILHQSMRDIEVSCLPLDLPENIEIDVSELGIGDSITLSSVTIENVELLGDPDQSIVSVIAPSITKEDEEEPVAEEAEGGESEDESTEEES